MALKNLNSLKSFLSENDLEFTHVETEEQFQEEIDKLQRENETVFKILSGELKGKFCCRKWRTKKRRICRWVKGEYKCVTHTTHVCVEKC